MDYFSEDSAHVASFSSNDPAASTQEDRITRKRWAKAVLAFYACLFLAGATAIGVQQSMTRSGGIEQHAMLRTGTHYFVSGGPGYGEAALSVMVAMP